MPELLPKDQAAGRIMKIAPNRITTIAPRHSPDASETGEFFRNISTSIKKNFLAVETDLEEILFRWH